MDKYSDKLKDPRWQKKRLEILQRDEWHCQLCFDSESTLIVHHRKYLLDKEPWDYPNELLIILCESCHDAERFERPEFEKNLLDILRSYFFSGDILTLAQGFNKLEPLHSHEVVASAYEWALSSKDIQRELLDSYFEHLKENCHA